MSKSEDMSPGEGSPAKVRGQDPGKAGKGKGLDGRWMLKIVYPNVAGLGPYLEAWLRDIAVASPASASAASIDSFGGPASYLSRPDDQPEFKQMLEETLVAFCPALGALLPNEDRAPLPRYSSLQHSSSMADLLDRVVRSLLRSPSTTQGSNASGYSAAQGYDPRRNVLSLGCRVAGPQAKSELLSVQGVACTFPNTTVNVIRSPPWELLLSRIGDDLMFLLLRQHAVLQRLPNRCYMQLAGRPVSELCRHLGLTSSALSTSVTATPKVGTAHGKKVTAAQPKAQKAPNADKADKRGSCEQPAHSSIRRGGLSSSALCGEAVENPYAAQAPSAAPASEAGAGAASSGQRRVGNPVEKSRPSPRPVTLLPRQRIFYSSTFVRKAGFPRGHSLSPCSRLQPPTPTTGKRSPVLTSPHAPGDKKSKPNEGGSGSGGSSDSAASRAAYRLLFDVFFPMDGGGHQRHEHGSEGTYKNNGSGAQRSGPEGMVAGKPGKGIGQGRKLPKRLRRVVPLLEEVVKRAHILNFGRLLEAHCPLPQSVLRRKAPGQAARGQCAREAEAGVPAVPPEPSLSPSLSDTSTMHDVRFEDAEAASAWTQAGSGNGSSGEDAGSSGDEEGSMNSFSTLRDPCSQSQSQSQSLSLSQSPAADGVPGNGACSDVDQDKGGGAQLPSSSNAQRRRRPIDDDGAEETPGELCTDEDGDCVAGPPIGGSGSPRATLDAEAVQAVHGGVHPAAVAVTGERGCQTNHDSPFSLGSDTTFMEMATPHRGVVDFLCQACHRMFPTELWGSKHNMVCLARAVERFVVLRRHENMSVLEVTSGMRTSDFDWMSLDAGSTTGPRRKKPRPLASGVLFRRDGAASMATAAQHADCLEGSGTCTVAGGRGAAAGCGGEGSRKRRRVDGASAGRHADHAESAMSSGRRCCRGTKREMTNGTARGKRKPRQVVEGRDKPRAGRGGGGRRGRAGNEGRRRCPPSELAKRAQLLEALVVWTFEDVIVPLLRSLFYVTECETASQEVFFFRKPVWAKFRTASLRHLTARQYRRITAHEAFTMSDGHDVDEATERPPSHPNTPGTSCAQNALETRKPSLHAGGAVAGGGGKCPGRVWAFPVAGVRLVPKANGVRAIANLSKRVWADRDCVQWVKGVPLPAPRRSALPSNLTSNSSARSDATRAAKDTRMTGMAARFEGQVKRGAGAEGGGGRAGGGGGGGGGAMATTNVRRGRHGKFGVGDVRGGSRRTLLPSTNMQLSNTFHVLKHEYHRKPSLVGAGMFGLDDVFARIRPFVSRNLRPLFSPLTRASENSEGRNSRGQGRTPPGSRRDGSAGYSPGGGGVPLAPLVTDVGRVASSNRSGGAEKCEGEWRSQRSERPAAGFSRPGGDGTDGTVERDRLGGRGAARPGGRPLLYFASVDIKHCYDTVDQARLIDIVRPLVTSEDYVVQKHTKAHPFKAMGRVQVSHVKEAVAMEDMSQFQTRCEELAKRSVDTIFTDQVVYGVVSRGDVLGMIEDHVKRNVVRVPAAGGSGRGAYFRQAVGIPQGSVLSGLLCNFFFGHIEKRLLGDILDSPPPSAPPPTSSINRHVPAIKHSNDSRRNGWNGDGVLPDGERDAKTSPARLSGCFRSAAWGLCGSGLGTGARVAAGAESDCPRPLPGKTCGVAEAIGDGSHGEGGACRARACWSQGDHPCETDSGGRCGRDRTREYEGGASAGETRPFPHPEGDYALLRQVDDFLLVTTSKEKAVAFVSAMHDKAKTGEWGFSVHEAKTKVNFDMTLEGRAGQVNRQVRRIEGNTFPWCGLRFNTKTCEIMADYSRYSKSGVSESVTVESGHAGACLLDKMKRFLSPKCHGLMLDEGELGINSRHTVLLNVYEMLLVCAAKTAASALRLPHGPAGNTSLLSNGALETTAYAYSLIQSRSNRRQGGFGTSKDLQCVCKIRRFEVTWLGLHAFREVYGAFSINHRGFNRCKLDVHNALEAAAGSGGLEEKRQLKNASPEGWRVRKAAKSEAQQRGAYRRLLRVVRCPDALGLLRTLTI